MSFRPRREGLSVCPELRQKPVYASSPRSDLASLIRAAIALVGLGWCALLSTPAVAQAVYGSIFGTVTDQFGAAVVGAKLTVTSTQKGVTFETTTNGTGNYSVTHLIPDQYDVRSEALGFKTVESTGIPVYADQAARVDIQLQVGARQETLTVSAEEIPLIKTDRADVATAFSEKRSKVCPYSIETTSLELLLRHFTVQVAARFIENPQGGIQSWLTGNTSVARPINLTVRTIVTLSWNHRDQSHPGISHADEGATQNYDAEFGQALAGVVTVQTKSGTNDWHGSVFEFRRTGWGQARNPFTQPPDKPLPAIKWNQFGGSIGGPIIKNRLFFFGDYQGTRRSNGTSVRLNVPTGLVRSTCLDLTVPFCNLSEYRNLFLIRLPATNSRIT
jgi:hypothetical protein